jgi:hypothetical protein
MLIPAGRPESIGRKNKSCLPSRNIPNSRLAYDSDWVLRNSFSVEKPEAFHRFRTAIWPIVDWFAVFPHAETASSLGTNVEFGRKITPFVFQIQHGGFDRVHLVVMRNQEENRRCIGRNAESGPELLLAVFVEETATVNKDQEVKSAWIIQFPASAGRADRRDPRPHARPSSFRRRSPADRPSIRMRAS